MINVGYPQDRDIFITVDLLKIHNPAVYYFDISH